MADQALQPNLTILLNLRRQDRMSICEAQAMAAWARPAVRSEDVLTEL
jgi:hypothetical protein